MWKLLAACAQIALIAQAQAPPSRPAFEIASVKLNTANGINDFVPRRSGDRVIMHNTQLQSVVNYAWNIHFGYQLAGSLDLPLGWNWYDIEARAESSTSDANLRLMFQALMEDRFKLKVHYETRPMDGYDLVIAKGGSKLTPASEDPKMSIDGRPIPKGFHAIVGGVDGPHVMGKGATIEQLVNSLAGVMRGPVVDKTGLQGAFDYDVPFARDEKADDNGTSLPSALQSIVGLKLERSKRPVDVLVIDHIEKPTEN